MTKEDRVCKQLPDGSIVRASDGGAFSDILAAAAHLRHAERTSDVKHALVTASGGWLVKVWNA